MAGSVNGGLIDKTVRRALDSINVRTVDVEIVHDEQDSETYFITVNLPPETPLIGGAKYLDTMVKVSDALLAIGDPRFPRIRLHHEGEEMAEEPDHPGDSK